MARFNIKSDALSNKALVLGEHKDAVCVKSERRWHGSDWQVTVNGKRLGTGGHTAAEAWESAALRIQGRTHDLNRSSAGRFDRMSEQLAELAARAGGAAGLDPRIEQLHVGLLRLLHTIK